MRAETWYTAEEAVLAGLADEWDGSADSAAAAFDLSRYTYAGRLEAPAPALAVAALHEPPAISEPGQPTERTDEMYDILMAGLRDRLGITDAEISEDAVLAALDEVLTEQAEAPTAALPQGVVAIESAVVDGMRAELAELRTFREEKADADRAALVEAAILDGRIPPARREHWQAALKADEEGMAPVLASLAPGTVPLIEIGHSDDVESAEDFFCMPSSTRPPKRPDHG